MASYRENLLVRSYRRFGSTRFGGWALVYIYSVIDEFLLRLTKGRFSLAGLAGVSIALVTTTGARSGLPRTTPLMLTPDGDNLALIASRGGTTKHPAWYYNLKANPQVEIVFPGRSGSYIAQELSGSDRDRIWHKANDLYDGGFDRYQSYTQNREIPVFLLVPVAD